MKVKITADNLNAESRNAFNEYKAGENWECVDKSQQNLFALGFQCCALRHVLSEIPSNGGEGESDVEKLAFDYAKMNECDCNNSLVEDAYKDGYREALKSQPTKEFSRDDVIDIIEKIGEKMKVDSWFKYDNKTGKWFVHTKGHLSSSELLTKFSNNTKQ